MVIDLVSPQGTTSRLLAKRPLDNSNDGLAKWPFTSVEFWDENPRGEWTVTIRDEKVMDLETRKIKLITHAWLKEKKPTEKTNRIDDLKNQSSIESTDKRCLNKGVTQF